MDHNTRNLLIKHGGFLYESNAYNDDIPYVLEIKSKNIVKNNDIRTPVWEMLNSVNDRPTLPLPFVIKPNDQGSTVGLTIIHDESEIDAGITEAFEHSDLVMVEEYIHGRELTVTVLGEKAYPIVEIKPSHEFYDYECKYTPGMSEYDCPARLNKNLVKQEKKYRIFLR